MEQKTIIYQKTLSETVALLNEFHDCESRRIQIAIAVGAKLNVLIAAHDNDEKVVTKLSREISNNRGKVTLPSELLQYRQLHLQLRSEEGALAINIESDPKLSSLMEQHAKKGNSRLSSTEDTIGRLLRSAYRALSKAECELQSLPSEAQRNLYVLVEKIDAISSKLLLGINSASIDKNGILPLQFLEEVVEKKPLSYKG